MIYHSMQRLWPLVVLAASAGIDPGATAQVQKTITPETSLGLPQNPDRFKTIQQAPVRDWCQTQIRFRQRNAARLAAAATGCMIEGPGDIPANRNACIPNVSTPIKTVRLKFNVFRNNDGSNPAATQAGVDAQVAQMNSDYAPARIQFIYRTAFLNSTQFRSFADSEETAMKETFADLPQQQHNVYVVNIEGAIVDNRPALFVH